MIVKVKCFCIGVEGVIIDGCEIQCEWLEQMVVSYNLVVYIVLINFEYIKFYLLDSIFNCYGKVMVLFVEEIMEGLLVGKMVLYVDVELMEFLVELVKKGQKLFIFMEVSLKFVDMGKVYLVGLVVIDDFVSLGIEMLIFSVSVVYNLLVNCKQNFVNFFIVVEEMVIELEEVQDDKLFLFFCVMVLFIKKEQFDDVWFFDVYKVVELVVIEQ